MDILNTIENLLENLSKASQDITKRLDDEQLSFYRCVQLEATRGAYTEMHQILTNILLAAQRDVSVAPVDNTSTEE